MSRPVLTIGTLVILTLSGFTSTVQAQDVELLGRIYGTPVPAAYYERFEAPGTFRFGRAFRGRNPQPVLGNSRLSGAFEGSSSRAVTGSFSVPVVMGLYSDSPAAPYDAATVQGHFFDGPNPTGTISDFYAQASNGLVQLSGVTFDWQRVSLTQAQVGGGTSGLGGGSRVGDYIVQILAQLDANAGVDWGAFDNDGPDGTPNSGDDDGFVDVLGVLHPTSGAECGGDRNSDKIWSHRWGITAQTGSPYTTSTASASGGFVKIDNYTIQPVRDCGGSQINQIGVFTHELGHGFGLPDLYAVGGEHAAVGKWDLMGTGSWGCAGTFNPARPCMMGAWSRAFLGWMNVVPLGFGADHGTFTVSPATTGGPAYQLLTGTDDYYLLENRRPGGFDGDVPGGGGLLIWHIDADVVASRRPSNTINSDPNRQGVTVVQADGLNQLWVPSGGRGDAGDLFPGSTGASAFHAGTTPSSFTTDGEATGVTIQDIGDDGTLITLSLLSRLQQISVSASGVPGGTGWVSFDAAAPVASGSAVPSAPFQRRSIEAIAGVPLGPGLRTGFEAWSDGAERKRIVVTPEADMQLNATYSGTEVELALVFESAVPGVVPGTMVSTPASADGWFPQNATVLVEARPATGFAFREWAGALTGSSNPVSVTMDAPRSATARFDVTFMPEAVGPTVAAEGGAPVTLQLQAANANMPVQWTLELGSLPEGVQLQLDGTIRGAALEPGVFPVRVRVVDAIGLEGVVSFALNVSPPTVPTSIVAAAFTRGPAGPSADLRTYLDRQGNANGVFDLGDFRAYVQSGTASATASTIVASTGVVKLPPVQVTPAAPRRGSHR